MSATEPLLPGLIGTSPALREVAATVRKVAPHKSTVLVLGQSGTGKEVVARALHGLSPRAAGPFVPINCGAIPETLIESELFGHARGAFTDAQRQKKGLIEEANGGTLFLDEIGELAVALQVKLLRFLQEDEVRRVGENQGVRVDVRVVAATSRDLAAMVPSGAFREDLYYRLNVVTLKLPPLVERHGDLPLLIDHFLARQAKAQGRAKPELSPEAERLLATYDWPGNVRELENALERALVLTEGDTLEVEVLPERLRRPRVAPPLTAATADAITSLFGDNLSIKRATSLVERELIRRALERTGGNRTKAAELLDLSPRALTYKIREYGLK